MRIRNHPTPAGSRPVNRDLHLSILACLIALAALPLLFPRRAGAIAAWSREYKTECSTCHAPFPHRNEFGEAFRRNGYVWPGRTPDQNLLDTEEFLRLTGIPQTLPLSVSARVRYDYDSELEDDKLTSTTDLQLHVGGNIHNKIGFYAHDLTGNAEAFGVFRRVLDLPLNVRFGRFAPQTTLWKENQAFTASIQAPLAFSVAGGGGPLLTPRDAVELNAVLGKRVYIALGGADRQDQDGMEYFGHISCKIGGVDYLGNQPDIDFDEESIWDYLSLTLSTYGYGGRIEQETYDTDFYRAGAEAEVLYGGFTLLASAVAGRDKDVDGTGLTVDSVVWMAEADYYFAPRYTVSLRYENEDVGNAEDGIVKRVVGNLTYVPFESVIFRLEGRFTRSQNDDDPTQAAAIVQAILHI